jgi:hypothetical protein
MDKKKTEARLPQALHIEALTALEQARPCPTVLREARR